MSNPVFWNGSSYYWSAPSAAWYGLSGNRAVGNYPGDNKMVPSGLWSQLFAAAKDQNVHILRMKVEHTDEKIPRNITVKSVKAATGKKFLRAISIF